MGATVLRVVDPGSTVVDENERRRQRAYRFALDPTPAQEAVLTAHADAARWAFNFALAQKKAANETWRLQVAELTGLGFTEAEARKTAVKTPNAPEVARRWTAWRDNPAADPWRGGICPWWRGINRFAFSSGFRDADQAWSNWMSSLAGKRAGRRVGEPRFKRKGRVTPSFRLHHDVKKPTIRTDGYRRLRMPNIGTVRLHDTAKRMVRALERGGRVQSVTCSRRGHRWYASVLVDEPDVTPGRETQVGPSHRQKNAGRIGVDLGTKALAALSEPVPGLSDEHGLIENPRHLKKARRRLVRAARQMSRRVGPDKRTGQKPSNRWKRARARLSKIQREVTVQRASHLHWITKTLSTSYAEVAIEDLNVAGMTRSAKGDVAEPGRNVRAKTGLNRSILDAAPGEFRRQLDYKTPWYGSTVAVCDRWAPTSKTCSACGAAKTKLPLSERVYTCNHCGFVCDRDVNAARNIAAMAVPVDPGGGRR
ncbi:putative transposase [Prauserella rugosa]|uniref:Putative transposase n=1 Tax=Prauserella rugosa TaxID=43354 RepID=A0A660C9B4_9PSEU|nr:putative transposase [Prauserella rugosa]